MKVKDMTSIIRVNKRVEIRDEEGYEICVTDADSTGIKPYLEREVFSWFPYRQTLGSGADFVIYLKDEESEATDGNI